MTSRLPRRLGVLVAVLLIAAAVIGGALLSRPSPAFSPAQGGDTEPPQIEITSPADHSVVTSATLTVSGTASDNVAVVEVDLSTDLETWTEASGTTTWTGNVTVVNGSNTVFARATDADDNHVTDSVIVVAHLPDGPPTRPTGFDFGFLGNPVTIAFLLTAIVVTIGTVAFVRRRRRRMGDGISAKEAGIPEEEIPEDWAQEERPGEPPVR
jgi:hypothetical protein